MSEHIALPSDPEDRKKIKKLIKDCVVYKEQIANIKASLDDVVASAAKEHDIPKKLFNKLVSTAYQANFEAVQMENENFQFLYEVLVRESEPSREHAE